MVKTTEYIICDSTISKKGDYRPKKSTAKKTTTKKTTSKSVDITQLQQDLMDKEKEISDLKKKITDLETKGSKISDILKEDLLTKEKELDDLKKEIEQKEEQIRSLKAEKEAEEKAEKEPEEIISMIKEQIIEANNYINELQSLINESKKDLDQKTKDRDNQLNKLKSKCMNLIQNIEVGNLASDIDNKDVEIGELIDLIKNTNGLINDAKNNLKSYREDLNEMSRTKEQFRLSKKAFEQKKMLLTKLSEEKKAAIEGDASSPLTNAEREYLSYLIKTRYLLIKNEERENLTRSIKKIGDPLDLWSELEFKPQFYELGYPEEVWDRKNSLIEFFITRRNKEKIEGIAVFDKYKKGEDIEFIPYGSGNDKRIQDYFELVNLYEMSKSPEDFTPYYGKLAVK